MSALAALTALLCDRLAPMRSTAQAKQGQTIAGAQLGLFTLGTQPFLLAPNKTSVPTAN